jgi:hypothetical protein
MDIKQKKQLTLDGSITAAYQVGEAGQAETTMRLAIDTPLVASRERPHCFISSAKGKSV